MSAKIVHFCFARTSGSTTVALNIAKASHCPQQHAFVLYSVETMRSDYGEDLDVLGCSWHYISKKRGMWDFSAFYKMAKTINKMNPCTVIFHGSRSLPVVFLLRLLNRKLPVVAILHGPDQEIFQHFRRWVCTGFCSLGTVSATVSHDMGKLIDSYYFLRWASKPLHVIPNGVDAEFWRPKSLDNKKDKGLYRIGMVSTLEAYKDHPTLLRSIKQLHDQGYQIKLELIGSGSTKENLEQLAQELGIVNFVHFYGTLPSMELRDIMHEWDILAHISHSESFGMAVVEGMLAARPIIATQVSGVKEVIQHEQTGLLVEKENVQELASAIIRLLKDSSFALNLGIAAQKYAQEHFSAYTMAEKYEQLVKSLC